MSFPIVLLALANTAAAALLTALLRRSYRGALTSVEDKNSGPVAFYRHRLLDLFGRRFSSDSVLAGMHFISLHLILPLWGFALFLRSDGNFLVIVAAIVGSIQLVQRLFPGEPSGDFH